MKKQNNSEGQPGEEVAFSLPVENEILMLKLKAEFGAECAGGGGNIPAAVVNEFLKSVYTFEQRFSQPVSSITVYEKIGRPYFRKAEELTDEELARALAELEQLMLKGGVTLDVLGAYEDRLIYTFITEEFFSHEMDNLDLPRCITHFCYEEFHPNHELDIRERAVEFLTQWLARKLSEYSWQLADPFIHPDTRIFSRESVLKMIHKVFDAYISFSSVEYSIDQVEFTWNDQRLSGRGQVSGAVSYEALGKDGENRRLEGPYTLYLSNTSNWWSIFYFDFPGFSWSA